MRQRYKHREKNGRRIKSSSELEGTPQRKKKKKISESPTSTLNRFAPLASEVVDDEDSFADANESNELAPVEEAGKPDVTYDPQATATNPPTQQATPGSGSNGVGQVK